MFKKVLFVNHGATIMVIYIHCKVIVSENLDHIVGYLRNRCLQRGCNTVSAIIDDRLLGGHLFDFHCDVP